MTMQPWKFGPVRLRSRAPRQAPALRPGRAGQRPEFPQEFPTPSPIGAITPRDVAPLTGWEITYMVAVVAVVASGLVCVGVFAHWLLAVFGAAVAFLVLVLACAGGGR